MGVYGKYTREKLKDYRLMLQNNIKVVSNIRAKYQRKKWRDLKPYVYIDAFAGPGVYDPDGQGFVYGSPIVAHDLLVQSGQPFLVWGIEKDEELFSSLKSLMSDKKNVEIIHGDAFLELKSIQDSFDKRTFGMLYFDCDMGLYTLQDVFELINSAPITKSPKLDIMIYLSGQWYKRHKMNPNFVHLKNLITKGNKKYQVIRELKGQQFTFLILTNYSGWAEWAGMGWHNVSSRKGQAILHELIYFEEELKKKHQIPLFPTELMQNTSGILHLELSERRPLRDRVGSVKSAISGLLRKYII